MSERHALASPGSWAELRDPSELRAGDAMDVMDSLPDDSSGAVRFRAVRNALITALVTNWQLPTPLPLPQVDAGVLRMLEIEDYNRLCELVEPAIARIFPAPVDPATPDEHAAAVADPASPTGPTAGS